MNRRTCFCFKKKIDKQLEERIIENCQKNPDFGKAIEEEGIDIQRLIDANKNKQQDELTKQFLEKDVHSDCRKWAIRN